MSRLDRWLYPGVAGHWDDEIFRERILAHIRPEHAVLDLGAGIGRVSQMHFDGLVARMCGVDPEPRVVDNPHLDEAKVGTGESIPYPDETFDVVFSDNVLEHLDDPMGVFRDVHRVLKPGGVFLAKTPNKRHYVARIAAATPHRFHVWVNRRRGRPSVDTFPTRYRANCRKDLQKICAHTNLELESIELVEGRPEYLRQNPVSYLAGFAYERAVNATSLLERYRCVLMMAARRPR